MLLSIAQLVGKEVSTFVQPQGNLGGRPVKSTLWTLFYSPNQATVY